MKRLACLLMALSLVMAFALPGITAQAWAASSSTTKMSATKTAQPSAAKKDVKHHVDKKASQASKSAAKKG